MALVTAGILRRKRDVGRSSALHGAADVG